MILNDLFPILGFVALATPHNTGPKDHDASCFIKFNDFIAGVTDATYDKWAHTALQNATAFEEIKSHILTMYNGIGDVTHSFIYDDEYGDCIDVKKQPGLRLQGINHIAPAPIALCPEKAKEADGPQVQFVESPLKLDLKDSFGNLIFCQELIIPFPRLTLEKLTSFRTLADSFSKGNDTEPALTNDNGGDGHSSRRQLVTRGAAQPHLSAVAKQTVKTSVAIRGLVFGTQSAIFRSRSSGIRVDPRIISRWLREAGWFIPVNSRPRTRFSSSFIQPTTTRRRCAGIWIAQLSFRPTRTGSWAADSRIIAPSVGNSGDSGCNGNSSAGTGVYISRVLELTKL